MKDLSSSLDRDPRPADLSPLVNQFRKVKPVKLGDNATEWQSAKPGGLRNARIQSGLAPYSGPWEAPQVMHLLRRTLFGVRKSELATFLNFTPDKQLTNYYNHHLRRHPH